MISFYKSRNEAQRSLPVTCPGLHDWKRAEPVLNGSIQAEGDAAFFWSMCGCWALSVQEIVTAVSSESRHENILRIMCVIKIAVRLY